MPKRAVPASPERLSAWPPALPAWRAMGLSLAPIGGAAFNGVAGLCAAAIAAVLVFAFARLHRRAPQAVSTGDLVASTVGAAAGRFTSLIQLAAYVLLGVGAALTLALQPLTGAPDLETALAGWWWPGWSVAVVVIAGAVVAYLPTRAVGATAAVLAGVGLLVFCYLALAIVARVMSGTPPMEFGRVTSIRLCWSPRRPYRWAWGWWDSRPPRWSAAAWGRWRALWEPRWVSPRLARWPCWWPPTSARPGFHLTAVNLSLIISQFFADAGFYWFATGALCVGSAALLALTWAATRVAGRLFGSGPEGVHPGSRGDVSAGGGVLPVSGTHRQTAVDGPRAAASRRLCARHRGQFAGRGIGGRAAGAAADPRRRRGVWCWFRCGSPISSVPALAPAEPSRRRCWRWQRCWPGLAGQCSQRPRLIDRQVRQRPVRPGCPSVAQTGRTPIRPSR